MQMCFFFCCSCICLRAVFAWWSTTGVISADPLWRILLAASNIMLFRTWLDLLCVWRVATIDTAGKFHVVLFFFKAELIQFDAYLLLSCGVFYTSMNVPGMVDTETHHKHVHWTCGISVKHDQSLCGILQVFYLSGLMWPSYEWRRHVVLGQS